MKDKQRARVKQIETETKGETKTETETDRRLNKINRRKWTHTFRNNDNKRTYVSAWKKERQEFSLKQAREETRA